MIMKVKTLLFFFENFMSTETFTLWILLKEKGKQWPGTGTVKVALEPKIKNNN